MGNGLPIRLMTDPWSLLVCSSLATSLFGHFNDLPMHCITLQSQSNYLLVSNALKNHQFLLELLEGALSFMQLCIPGHLFSCLCMFAQLSDLLLST